MMKNRDYAKVMLYLGLASIFLMPVLAQQPMEEPGQQKIEEEETEAAGQASVRVAVDMVRVDATVQTKDGHLIKGLSKENFEIYEDKVKQEIAYFEPVEGPITAVLLTEFSKAVYWEFLWEAVMASYSFVDQMRPGDWFAVMAYDMRPEILIDFTQNKAEVYGALRKLNAPTYRESNLYDAVWDVLDRTEELDQKLAIILLSSGLDTFSKKNLSETLDRVKRTNAVIYPVSLGGNFRARYEDDMLPEGRLNLQQGDAALRYMAKYTGGTPFFPRFSSQFDGIFQTISALTRHRYALGFIPSEPANGEEYRKIRVQVNADIDGDGEMDDLKVLHREGYQISPDEID